MRPTLRLLPVQILAAALICGFTTCGRLTADTITLKSGYRLHGKVTEDRSRPGKVVVEIAGGGRVVLPATEVTAVEKNDRTGPAATQPAAEGKPAPAAAGELMAVKLKKGHGYYGSGPLYGVKSPESTDTTLVLIIPGVGEMRLPQSAVEKMEPVRPMGSAQPVPAVANPRVIRMTHLVRLKNGSSVPGTLVPTSDKEPVTLEVGGIGRVYLPRERVASVDSFSSEIVLPEPEPEPAPETAPAAQPKAATPPSSTGEEGGEPQARAERLDPELAAEIQDLIYDLTRNRTQHRVRAEKRLMDIGSPAIPFLDRVARHPFDLTRRSVQRIVRDVGDPAGIPIAIDALLDDDDIVRETAGEALRRITRLELGFRPDASEKERFDAQMRWRQWWEEERRRLGY